LCWALPQAALVLRVQQLVLEVLVQALVLAQQAWGL
jgi:hypothetical protein